MKIGIRTFHLEAPTNREIPSEKEKESLEQIIQIVKNPQTDLSTLAFDFVSLAIEESSLELIQALS